MVSFAEQKLYFAVAVFGGFFSASAFRIFFLIFIWLHQVLVAACWIFNLYFGGMETLSCGGWDLVPWPGLKLGPLHWEFAVLAMGPPWKAPVFSFQCKRASAEYQGANHLFFLLRVSRFRILYSSLLSIMD